MDVYHNQTRHRQSMDASRGTNDLQNVMIPSLSSTSTTTRCSSLSPRATIPARATLRPSCHMMPSPPMAPPSLYPSRKRIKLSPAPPGFHGAPADTKRNETSHPLDPMAPPAPFMPSVQPRAVMERAPRLRPTPPPPPPPPQQQQQQQFPPSSPVLLSPGGNTKRLVPCKARGMPPNHNSKTAHIHIPVNCPHGQLLVCSHPECAKSGRRFRYCAQCQLPVAKRNFMKRHSHHYNNDKIVTTSETPAAQQEDQQDDINQDDKEQDAAITASPVATKNMSLPCPPSSGANSEQAAHPSPHYAKKHPRQDVGTVCPMTPVISYTPTDDDHDRNSKNVGPALVSPNVIPSTVVAIGTTSSVLTPSPRAGRPSHTFVGSSFASDRVKAFREMRRVVSFDAAGKYRHPAAALKGEQGKTTREYNESAKNREQDYPMSAQLLPLEVDWLTLLYQRPSIEDEAGMAQWMRKLMDMSENVLPKPQHDMSMMTCLPVASPSRDPRSGDSKCAVVPVPEGTITAPRMVPSPVQQSPQDMGFLEQMMDYSTLFD